MKGARGTTRSERVTNTMIMTSRQLHTRHRSRRGRRHSRSSFRHSTRHNRHINAMKRRRRISRSSTSTLHRIHSHQKSTSNRSTPSLPNHSHRAPTHTISSNPQISKRITTIARHRPSRVNINTSINSRNNANQAHDAPTRPISRRKVRRSISHHTNRQASRKLRNITFNTRRIKQHRQRSSRQQTSSSRYMRIKNVLPDIIDNTRRHRRQITRHRARRRGRRTNNSNNVRTRHTRSLTINRPILTRRTQSSQATTRTRSITRNSRRNRR